MTTLSLEVIRQLPKAELHCHLDGFCRPSTIIELAKEQNVTLPTTDLEELKKIMTAPPDCPDLVTYLRCFDGPLAVMQYPYAITRIFYEACEDAVKDGIAYLELRFAPALHTRNGHSIEQILQAVVDGVNLAQSNLPITVRVICCAMRMMTPELNNEVAEVCYRFRDSGVVAFDLAGPENGFPPHKHIDAFDKITQNAMHLTIHAGEAFGALSIRRALECGTERIGHGTRIVEESSLIQEIIDRRVTLEMCVTSNCQTKAIDKLEKHPIKKLFDMGVVTVPCTDNPTVSGCTLSGEYHLLHTKLGFKVSEVVRLIDYGFRSAFVDANLKKRLRIEAIRRTLDVLRQNNVDVAPVLQDYKHYLDLGIDITANHIRMPKYPSIDLCKKLPKIDVDARLNGSCPLKLMYEMFTQTPDDQKIRNFQSYQEFEDFLTKSDVNEAKKVIVSLLQKEANIRRCVRGILEEAHADNVRYMELTVAPLRHVSTMKPTELIDCILDEIQKFSTGKKFQANIVLAVNTAKDTPMAFQSVAELAVQYKEKGVAGVSTVSEELSVADFKYFKPVFDYLRQNFIKISMFTGVKCPVSIPVALSKGYAVRISGAFKAPYFNAIYKKLAARDIPVLCVDSKRMRESVDK